MNSCVADLSLAVHQARAISDTRIFSRSAELLYGGGAHSLDERLNYAAAGIARLTGGLPDHPLRERILLNGKLSKTQKTGIHHSM